MDLRFLFPILLLVGICRSGQTQVAIQDSLALVEFYYATGGDQWNDNTNWLDGPVSTWHGIYVQGDRVNAIIMYDNGLNGYLPEDLQQLTHLQSLQLSTSSFSGTIPDIFGQMPEFSQLGLEGCGLTGEIPASLGNCLNLKRIDLDKNNLTGTIPSSLAACSQLIDLNVGENDLSGPFPEVIQSFPVLKELTLSDNNFSGPVPDWIASMTELQWLLLNGNNFSGPTPFLGNKPNLTNFNISDNSLTGNLEDILGYYDNLKYFALFNTNISGELTPIHFNPDKIIILDANSNQIHTLGFFADWMEHPNFLGMRVNDNHLDFDDLLPNSTMPDNKFFYFPQKTLGNDTVVTLLPGEEYAIYSPMQDDDIQYQWYFNQMLIEGLENYDLILPPFTPELVGDFYFTATHVDLPDLTIESGITTLVEGTSSIDNLDKSLLSITPNPTSDHIRINADPMFSSLHYQLYTSAGQLLERHVSLSAETIISLTDYASGIYFLKWISDETTGIETIIIK